MSCLLTCCCVLAAVPQAGNKSYVGALAYAPPGFLPELENGAVISGVCARASSQFVQGCTVFLHGMHSITFVQHCPSHSAWPVVSLHLDVPLAIICAQTCIAEAWNGIAFSWQQ